jgi:glycerol kinase
LADQFEDQEIPIAGVAGDQHASLFGQACFGPGMVKNTYGTGCFVLANTGEKRIFSGPDLISTIAWGIGDQVTYALEGSVFSAGSAVQWLRDGLGIIDSTDMLEILVESVDDNGGVYFVPAFSGLGSPHWDPEARGTIVGLTRGSSAAHLARAALEATAYQTRDVIGAIEFGTPFDVDILRVDGGGSRSRFMMQFQADILGVPIEKSLTSETTAQGAGYLAGLAIGLWKGLEDIEILWQSDIRLDPQMPVDVREKLYSKWQRAVQRSISWDTRV